MTTPSNHDSVLKAPTVQELPAAKPRGLRGGPDMREIRVRLEVVTPILGGSHQTRAIDTVDVIRAPTVRGHLRFWWRALYASRCSSAEELFQRESALWGCAAEDRGGRSSVEIRIEIEREGVSDNSPVHPYASGGQPATPGAYALWPAREPPAPRRKPGTQFQIQLKLAATAEVEVRNALRAWILFGGYGGRTRRGLGSLRVLEDIRTWLPGAATRVALTNLFGGDIFAVPGRDVGDVPLLAGAAIHFGRTDRNAEIAWISALEWLKEFRQGTAGQFRAREPGTGKLQPQRPSISNWPEADKIRWLTNRTITHAPRHNAEAAWPRAGFGLPIHGQFQTTDRRGTRNAYVEPGHFEICWRSPKLDRPGEFEVHDRIASPLIVKALPLADGSFAPCALWLNRANPARGEVLLRNVHHSAAPFDRLIASGDKALFGALINKKNLREAFLDWLHTKYQTTVVAP